MADPVFQPLKPIPDLKVSAPDNRPLQRVLEENALRRIAENAKGKTPEELLAAPPFDPAANLEARFRASGGLGISLLGRTSPAKPEPNAADLTRLTNELVTNPEYKRILGALLKNEIVIAGSGQHPKIGVNLCDDCTALANLKPETVTGFVKALQGIMRAMGKDVEVSGTFDERTQAALGTCFQAGGDRKFGFGCATELMEMSGLAGQPEIQKMIQARKMRAGGENHRESQGDPEGDKRDDKRGGGKRAGDKRDGDKREEDRGAQPVKTAVDFPNRELLGRMQDHEITQTSPLEERKLYNALLAKYVTRNGKTAPQGLPESTYIDERTKEAEVLFLNGYQKHLPPGSEKLTPTARVRAALLAFEMHEAQQELAGTEHRTRVDTTTAKIRSGDGFALEPGVRDSAIVEYKQLINSYILSKGKDAPFDLKGPDADLWDDKFDKQLREIQSEYRKNRFYNHYQIEVGIVGAGTDKLLRHLATFKKMNSGPTDESLLS